MPDAVEEIDCDGEDVSQFLVNASDAIEGHRRKDSLAFALSFHTNGEGTVTTEDPTEVARTAETFDRFLRGDGAAHGQDGVKTCSS